MGFWKPLGPFSAPSGNISPRSPGGDPALVETTWCCAPSGAAMGAHAEHPHFPGWAPLGLWCGNLLVGPEVYRACHPFMGACFYNFPSAAHSGLPSDLLLAPRSSHHPSLAGCLSLGAPDTSFTVGFPPMSAPRHARGRPGVEPCWHNRFRGSPLSGLRGTSDSNLQQPLPILAALTTRESTREIPETREPLHLTVGNHKHPFCAHLGWTGNNNHQWTPTVPYRC